MLTLEVDAFAWQINAWSRHGLHRMSGYVLAFCLECYIQNDFVLIGPVSAVSETLHCQCRQKTCSAT